MTDLDRINAAIEIIANCARISELSTRNAELALQLSDGGKSVTPVRPVGPPKVDPPLPPPPGKQAARVGE